MILFHVKKLIPFTRERRYYKKFVCLLSDMIYKSVFKNDGKEVKATLDDLETLILKEGVDHYGSRAELAQKLNITEEYLKQKLEHKS